MDGPIADFNLEAVRAHLRVGKRFHWLPHYGTPLSLTADILARHYPLGTSVSTVLNPQPNTPDDHWHESMEAFWQPIRIDPMFWQNLEPFTWTKNLVKMLEMHCKHLIICTTPDKHRNSYSGKYHWLERMGLAHLELITIKQKWRLADPQCLLIDDSPKHIESFVKEGGQALLFPCISNEHHPYLKDPVSYIHEHLTELLDNTPE